MTRIAIIDTALTGVRLARSQPRSVLAWGGVQLLLGVVAMAAMVTMLGPQWGSMLAAGAGHGQGPNPEQLWAKMIPVYATILPVELAVFAVLTAAVNRAVLRPDDSRFAYLRLGADEARQAGLILLMVLFGFGLELLVILPAVMIAVIVGVLVKPLAGLAAFLSAAAAFGVLIFVMARLSVAAAATFDRRRITLVGVWPLTKGQALRIVGVYALSVVLAFVVLALVTVIGFAAAALAGAGTDWTAFMFRPDTASVARYFTPARILFLIINAVGAGLTWPLLMAPAAEIYRQVREEPAAPPTHAGGDASQPWGG